MTFMISSFEFLYTGLREVFEEVVKQGGFQQYAVVIKFIIKQDPQCGKRMSELVATHFPVHPDQGSGLQNIGGKYQVS